MNNGMYSSKKQDYETPQELYDKLNLEFGFTLDPCSTHENAKCKTHYTISENGLKQNWTTEIVFMNPPYGREIKEWVEKAYGESLKGAVVVCLLPARTDTRWWHDYCMKGEIRFIKGRLKFGSAKNSAPFPSAIVIFNGQKNKLMSMIKSYKIP